MILYEVYTVAKVFPQALASTRRISRVNLLSATIDSSRSTFNAVSAFTSGSFSGIVLEYSNSVGHSLIDFQRNPAGPFNHLSFFLKDCIHFPLEASSVELNSVVTYLH